MPHDLCAHEPRRIGFIHLALTVLVAAVFALGVASSLSSLSNNATQSTLRVDSPARADSVSISVTSTASATLRAPARAQGPTLASTAASTLSSSSSAAPPSPTPSAVACRNSSGSTPLPTSSAAPTPSSTPSAVACRNALSSRWVDARGDAQFEATHTLAHGGRDVPARLTIPGCDLASITPPLARECLRGQHLAFIGDSVTRYQYLNLAQYIQTGNWTPFSAEGDALTEDEREWPSWTAWFTATVARLGGNEICDCYRPLIAVSRCAENRFYYNAVFDVRLTFILFFADAYKTKHHRLDALNVSCNRPRGAETGGVRPADARACAQALCTPGECVGPFEEWYEQRWPYNLITDVLEQLGAGVAPVDNLFFNQGFHMNPAYMSAATQADLVDALVLARDRGWVRTLWWKMTTMSTSAYNIGHERAWVNAALVPRGFRVFDSHALTGGEDSPFSVALRATDGVVAATWDDVMHFRPFVYRGLNEALLAGICPRPA